MCIIFKGHDLCMLVQSFSALTTMSCVCVYYIWKFCLTTSRNFWLVSLFSNLFALFHSHRDAWHVRLNDCGTCVWVCEIANKTYWFCIFLSTNLKKKCNYFCHSNTRIDHELFTKQILVRCLLSNVQHSIWFHQNKDSKYSNALIASNCVKFPNMSNWVWYYYGVHLFYPLSNDNDKLPILLFAKFNYDCVIASAIDWNA